jgi:hypothetical protein
VAGGPPVGSERAPRVNEIRVRWHRRIALVGGDHGSPAYDGSEGFHPSSRIKCPSGRRVPVTHSRVSRGSARSERNSRPSLGSGHFDAPHARFGRGCAQVGADRRRLSVHNRNRTGATTTSFRPRSMHPGRNLEQLLHLRGYGPPHGSVPGQAVSPFDELAGSAAIPGTPIW